MNRSAKRNKRTEDKLFTFSFFARLWTGVSGDFSTLFALDHELWDD